MTDLLGSSGLLLVASAAIFGPLAGWLAGRRGRNAILWFVFGALLGPLAVLLLAISPRGTAPCATRRSTAGQRNARCVGAP